MEYKENFFICPLCKSSLLDKGDSYLCIKCSSLWPVKEGIPVFLDKDVPYWHDLSKEEALKMLKEAETNGWRASLDKFLTSTLKDFVCNYKRINWKYIIDSDTGGNILDIGSGWGTLAFAFAKQSRNVFALEPVWERVKFIQIVKEQENLTNLYPVCASALKIPFNDNFFDVVIANGVLEWIAFSDTSSPPQKVQEKMLTNIYRILKQGGSLYIGIENALAYFYFLGKKDPHSGLRFATFMPRFLANFYSKMVKKKEYRTYIYSINGYKELLRKAGFKKISFYTPVPGYLNFKYIVSLDAFNVFKYWVSNVLYPQFLFSPYLLRRIIKIMARTLEFLPLGFLRYFVPDLSIVAEKS